MFLPNHHIALRIQLQVNDRAHPFPPLNLEPICSETSTTAHFSDVNSNHWRSSFDISPYIFVVLFYIYIYINTAPLGIFVLALSKFEKEIEDELKTNSHKFSYISKHFTFSNYGFIFRRFSSPVPSRIFHVSSIRSKVTKKYRSMHNAVKPDTKRSKFFQWNHIISY